MSNEHKEWLKEQSFESLANDNLRIKLELKTAKDENEKLKELIRKLAIDKIEFDRLKRNETDKVDYSFGQIEKLTQQNKQLREALEKIAQGSCKECSKCLFNGGKCLGGDKRNLEECEQYWQDIAQQALKEVNNEK